jgi:hypothetical protein
MKTTITAFAAITLALGTAGCSGADTSETQTAAVVDGSITGTWRGDPTTAQSENGDSNFTLIDGKFTCNSCLPPFSIVADGEWQPLDRPGSDEIMVKIVDDKTVMTATRLKGRDLGNSTYKVSDDGSSLTQTYADLSAAEATEGSMSMTRTAAAPAGAHALSGGWKLAAYGEISEAALLFTYNLDGEKLSAKGNGASWTATLGGTPVAIEGDNAGTTVKVEKLSANMYRQTYIQGGEVVNVSEMTLDGDTMSVVNTDPRDNSVFRYTAKRQ